jgi:hypothetical protein
VLANANMTPEFPLIGRLGEPPQINPLAQNPLSPPLAKGDSREFELGGTPKPSAKGLRPSAHPCEVPVSFQRRRESRERSPQDPLHKLPFTPRQGRIPCIQAEGRGDTILEEGPPGCPVRGSAGVPSPHDAGNTTGSAF